MDGKFSYDEISRFVLAGKNCCFLTLVLNPEYIDTMSRRKFYSEVEKYLSSISDSSFIFHVDDHSCVMHAHAIVRSDKLDFNEWGYGKIRCEFISPDKMDKSEGKVIRNQARV